MGPGTLPFVLHCFRHFVIFKSYFVFNLVYLEYSVHVIVTNKTIVTIFK